MGVNIFLPPQNFEPQNIITTFVEVDFWGGKTTSIYFVIGRTTIYFINEGGLNLFCNWKTTSICFSIGRRPLFDFGMEDNLTGKCFIIMLIELAR